MLFVMETATMTASTLHEGALGYSNLITARNKRWTETACTNSDKQKLQSKVIAHLFDHKSSEQSSPSVALLGCVPGCKASHTLYVGS